jgi:hypothetical protein
MKPLILTFFAVIFGYSLFIPDEEMNSAPVFKEKQPPFYDELRKQHYADSVSFIKYPVADSRR